MYEVLVHTGLRRGELATLAWGDLSLDGPTAWLTVRAENAKNKQEDSLPIRTDLAAKLRAWWHDRGSPGPRERVFNVPIALVQILDKDLKAAGIAKVDERGRTFDVHGFRHTTATYLAKAGVPPRAAQRHMRHSDIRLTLGTYTDPSLLDDSSALEALPSLNGAKDVPPQQATGTDGNGLPTGLPKLGPS